MQGAKTQREKPGERMRGLSLQLGVDSLCVWEPQTHPVMQGEYVSVDCLFPASSLAN